MSEKFESNPLQQPILSRDQNADTSKDFKKLNGDILSQSDLGDDPFTTVVKRIFAESNLLIMCVNSISSIFSISAAVGLIPYSSGTIYGTFCDYGDSMNNLYMQCPYLPSPEFQTIVALWCAYFAFYFTWRYYWTSSYETNDLRYFLYYDKFNSTIINRIMVVVGVVLTFGSGLYGIATVAHNGTTGTIIPIIVFICVNCYNLYELATCRLVALSTLDVNTADIFKYPIVISTEPIWTLSNLNGMFVTHFKVFDHISNALAFSYLHNNDKHIRLIGSVEQLKLAMKTINPLELLK